MCSSFFQWNNEKR